MVAQAMADRIARVKAKIADAAHAAGRNPSDIKLMGVSKFHPYEEMEQAAPMVDLLGENRVQEAAEKRALWSEKGKPFAAPWHLIGQLQKNKARKALDTFDLIETVDSLELAATLNRICQETDKTLPIYIEVNMSHEASKSGISEQEAPHLADEICGKCPQLRLEGLMTIAPITTQETPIRRAFAGLRELAGKLRTQTGLALPELSMGMSGDFEYAIAEGSTIVRVGTAIFGERKAIKK